MFHKVLRPLNITNVSLLQASTETPSTLFRRSKIIFLHCEAVTEFYLRSA